MNFSIINGGSTIKANLLKFFLKKSYNITDSIIYVINKNKIIRKWKIVENNSHKVFYEIIQEPVLALGKYEYYVKDKNNDGLQIISVDMSVYPDSTSILNILELTSNNLTSKVGKIKVTPNVGFNVRGILLLESIANGSFYKEAQIDNNIQKITMTNKEVASFIRSNFLF